MRSRVLQAEGWWGQGACAVTCWATRRPVTQDARSSGVRASWGLPPPGSRALPGRGCRAGSPSGASPLSRAAAAGCTLARPGFPGFSVLVLTSSAPWLPGSRPLTAAVLTEVFPGGRSPSREWKQGGGEKEVPRRGRCGDETQHCCHDGQILSVKAAMTLGRSSLCLLGGALAAGPPPEERAFPGFQGGSDAKPLPCTPPPSAASGPRKQHSDTTPTE